MFFCGLFCPCFFFQGVFAHLLYILMEDLQFMFQNLTFACFVEQTVKTAVQFKELIVMSLLFMKCSQHHGLFHFFQCGFIDPLCRHPSTKPLQPCTDQVNILYILFGDSVDESTAIGDDRYQTFQFQLTKCLSDRCSGNTDLFSDCSFPQFIAMFIMTV